LLELSADSMRRRTRRFPCSAAWGLVPAYLAAKVAAGAVSWDYTAVLNIVLLLLAAGLLVFLFRSGGAPVLR
jgi:hypothetical protein